ncbi:MAG: hypothetical protein FD167_3844 [bacterium]|nr:MAG: hypothetical protein FD167_3844 [bacterium]
MSFVGFSVRYCSWQLRYQRIIRIIDSKPSSDNKIIYQMSHHKPKLTIIMNQKITPYCWIKESAKRYVLLALVLIDMVLIAIFSYLDQSLRNQTTPQGIISFQLASSETKTKAIVDSWNAASRDTALFSLGLDYLFLFIYPLTLSLMCHLVASRIWQGQSFVSKLGSLLAWLVLLAGLLDAIENYSLLQILKFSDYIFWPILAKYCATAKFGLIGLAMLYVILAFTIGKLYVSKSSIE